jgi:hypothetical protein
MKRVSRETPRAIMSDFGPKLLHDSDNNAARSYGCDTARTMSKHACRRGEAIISNSVCAYVMGRRVNGHDVRSRLYSRGAKSLVVSYALTDETTSSSWMHVAKLSSIERISHSSVSLRSRGSVFRFPPFFFSWGKRHP